MPPRPSPVAQAEEQKVEFLAQLDDQIQNLVRIRQIARQYWPIPQTQEKAPSAANA